MMPLLLGADIFNRAGWKCKLKDRFEFRKELFDQILSVQDRFTSGKQL
jgi:hypothetical protein